MNEEIRRCWDQRYRESITDQQPAYVLTAHQHLLPASGRALDLACGLGANALLLARQGLETWAWDISPIAIARLEDAARLTNPRVHAEVRDVLSHPPEPDSFDVIVVSHFLERELAPALQAALRPGGLLFYQTFTLARVDNSGPSNPAYRLADNELLKLFEGLKIRVYREEDRVGDVSRGFRNEAFLVAQR